MRRNSNRNIEPHSDENDDNQKSTNLRRSSSIRKASTSSKSTSVDVSERSIEREGEKSGIIIHSTNSRPVSGTDELSKRSMNISHESTNREQRNTSSTDKNERRHVDQLRSYYDGLSHTVQQTKKRADSTNQPRKLSHTIKPLRVETDLIRSPQASNSVEELRNLFEQGHIPRSASVEQPSPPPNPGSRQSSLSRPTAYNTREFTSRPPKYRTPSPTLQPRLPTPPPLPLPPYPGQYSLRSSKGKPMDDCRRNYITQFEHIMPPINSTHLPFRSRSVNVDHCGNHLNTNQPIERKIRYRAGSLTQRSLSPEPDIRFQQKQKVRGRIPSGMDSFTGREEWKRTQYNRPVYSACRAIGTENERNYQHISTYGEPPDTIVHANKSPADGVYVRSAVVYERVGDNGDPKTYITTYVVSPNRGQVSDTTKEATNLWVAEHTLDKTSTSSEWPPYRTQTLNRTESSTAAKLNRSASVRYRHSPSKLPLAQRPNSLSICPNSTRIQTDSLRDIYRPKPLPTPPPITSHPHLLRCASRPTSPHRSPSIETCNRAVQCSTRPTRYSPSPTRSWSVKSLSPLPFRSQPLNSTSHLHESLFSPSSPSPSRNYTQRPHWLKELQRRRSPLFRSSYNLNSYPHELTYHNSNNGVWIPKAKSLSRERLAYHEVRGSWSPPHVRSPARQIPNDLEEDTEREIRERVRRKKPLSLVPKLYGANPTGGNQATQTYNFDRDEDDDEDVYEPSKELSPNGIDDTPITDNFHEKRAYFEKLIRNNQILAQCSFYSNCYHCPPHLRSPRRSQFESDDARNESGYQSQSAYYTRPSSNMSVSSYHGMRNYPSGHYSTNHTYDEITNEPQQYSASEYTIRQHPQSSKWDQHRPSDKHQIAHEYYAKPAVGMPKVAPTPPFQEKSIRSWNSVNTRGGYSMSPPTRAELMHSPTLTSQRGGNVPSNRSDHSYNENYHSPPCRFYSLRGHDAKDYYRNNFVTTGRCYDNRHMIGSSSAFDRYHNRSQW